MKFKLSSFPSDAGLSQLFRELQDNVVPTDSTGRANVTGLSIGDPAKEGSWRIVPLNNTLSFQRFEGGQWVEKGSF